MVFIVITTIIQGPPGPYIDITYHGTEESARESYQKSIENIGDDYVTVVLVKLNTTTLEETILEYVQGSEDDGSDEDTPQTPA